MFVFFFSGMHHNAWPQCILLKIDKRVGQVKNQTIFDYVDLSVILTSYCKFPHASLVFAEVFLSAFTDVKTGEGKIPTQTHKHQ